ncbi:hemerythrin domain-containing protein [Gallaecimonas sp. GXIMD4217]|uniref:hemerythrin domain-containing protein n=1 Tax=Gallaecimonas sp. GXIMD4217 TaxID=3131927 RepID=UPI00311AC898
MLDLLRRDHSNIRRLLAVLDAKAAALRAEQVVRFDLVRDILDYLYHYADQVHHAEEELLLDAVGEKFADPSLGDEIRKQHKALSEDTGSLRQLVDMVMMDAVVPKDEVLAALENYVAHQREHMRFEEGELFPALEQAMESQDWDSFGQRLKEKTEKDPLFGIEVKASYQALWSRLNEESED